MTDRIIEAVVCIAGTLTVIGALVTAGSMAVNASRQEPEPIGYVRPADYPPDQFMLRFQCVSTGPVIEYERGPFVRMELIQVGQPVAAAGGVDGFHALGTQYLACAPGEYYDVTFNRRTWAATR